MEPLQETIEEIKAAFKRELAEADSLDRVRDCEVRFLGRKAGLLPKVLRKLGELGPNEKKTVGAAANEARLILLSALLDRKKALSSVEEKVAFDPTLPGTAQPVGARHIINQVMGQMCHTFYGMGFEVAYGPHVETDHYNFEALNFPPDHPARDMQDTFFVEGGRVLRTHTTPVQARELEKRTPPVKMITPGKTFRNEAISTRAHVSFHQVDGFLVDEGVTMADLKGCLVAFCKSFFGENVKLKFRPSFFPFTEPSAEVDISCILCGGDGCQLCQQTGWLEILGCGMIHPNVLEMAGMDSEKYTGYAFGIGVERIAMLKYKIKDIRLFFNNNHRFLRQFF